LKDTSNKEHKSLFLPLALAYITICSVWVLLNHMDWIYLFFTLFAVPFVVYHYYVEKRYQKEAEQFIKDSESKRTEDRIKHMAYYDDLTGLPNRRLFRDKLGKALIEAKKNDELIAVMFIDIDRFKLVNESLGHDYGDNLIIQVAKRLTKIVKDKGFIARMEGDEFALFYTGLITKDDSIELAQDILKEIEPVFLLTFFQLHITLSIGVSILLHEEDDAGDLMKYANTALSRAKEQGRNNFQFYTPAMNVQSVERLTLENDLRRAIEKREFMIYYQPQINISTGETVGAEALIRWDHPTRGIVSPGEFIPLAEENGMIVTIGDWVLETVCKQNKEWQDKGLSPFPISVNLSPRQFLQQNLVEKVADVLSKTGLEARYLELEITESMTMDVEHAIDSLFELKKLGVSISIDDFGTGYSSLSYLKKFPINKLKIDRSFVRDLMDDPNDAAIVSTIIATAHGLDLKVIAEGVETFDQLNYLNDKLCNEVQGYLFSPPIKTEEFLGTLQKLKEAAVTKELEHMKRE
jgi:diguanylate cyclase (GGDEF)-like protein